MESASAAPMRPNPPGKTPPGQTMPFVIARDGTWYYRGTPIRRKELVCLFAGILTRDQDGAYLLETPVERGHITVEDSPFVAVELDWKICRGGSQHLSFRLNTDQVVCAGCQHPIRIAPGATPDERVPYLHVRDGKGALPIEARICRSVFYELVALGETQHIDGQETLGVWSGGCFFPLGLTSSQEQFGAA